MTFAFLTPLTPKGQREESPVYTTKRVFLVAVTLVALCALILGQTASANERNEYLDVNFDLAEDHDFQEATAPRTMSISTPVQPADRSSEEARTQTLALVIASAFMMTALALAMGYIYYRNLNGEFLPENSFMDFLVSKLAIVGLIGMIAAVGILVYVSGDGIAEDVDVGEGQLDFNGDTSLWEVDNDATPTGTTYLLYENHGGTWCDAEKTAVNTDDDLLCWAFAASNTLWWTGWGLPPGETFRDSEDMGDEFVDHWEDKGSFAKYGWDWWFDGTLPGGYPPANNWADVDVAGGGNYWSSLNPYNYIHEESDND
jgi:hypothetical protein